jgi:hypothetical protein
MHTIKITISVFLIISFIVAGSIISLRMLKNTSERLEKHIDMVEEGAASGNWNMARMSLENIEKDWSKAEGVWTVLIDHSEIDNIENSLARMKKYINTEDSSLALGELSNLRQYVKHIPEKESFSIKNIF